MTRSVAMRALAFFMTIAALAASIVIATYVPMTEVLFLISASLCAVFLVFGLAMPAQAPVPVRVRRRRH
jgi:hypothetical protein